MKVFALVNDLFHFIIEKCDFHMNRPLFALGEYFLTSNPLFKESFD